MPVQYVVKAEKENKFVWLGKDFLEDDIRRVHVSGGGR